MESLIIVDFHKSMIFSHALLLCLHRVRNVDYLLMGQALLQLVHLGTHHDLVSDKQSLSLVAGSSLRRLLIFVFINKKQHV